MDQQLSGDLKHTPLYEAHQKLHAHMGAFAGYLMPLYYRVQTEEHLQVRQDVGMFDVSHMGIIDIIGKEATSFLRILLANDVHKLKTPGKALYSCMLNNEGGILDDLIVYFISKEHYRLVVNAATKAEDLTWMLSHQMNFDIKIIPLEMGLIAIQGPNAIEKVTNVYPEMISAYSEMKSDLSKLKPFEFLITKQDWLISRTGYTGEDGLEIILPKEETVHCWDVLLKNGIPPIGLGARDTLRLEAGLSLYGQDMDQSTDPFESNLGWTVALNDPERHFIGRAAIEKVLSCRKRVGAKKLVGIILQDKGILRHNQIIIKDNQNVGIVTSGSYSPSLKLSIGLARIKSEIENDCKVDIRGKLLSATIVQPPFVRRKH